MNKRVANDIWQNLHELPLCETEEFIAADELVRLSGFIDRFGRLSVRQTHGPVKHLLSHQRIFAQFLVLDKEQSAVKMNESWFFVEQAQLQYLAQPQLIFAFLKKVLP